MRLVVIVGTEKGRTFNLPDGQALVIGRHPSCNIRLSEKGLSRTHCSVERSGASCRVRDLGSRNGVFVNGKRTQDAVLSHGDCIRAGDAVLRYESSETKARPAARKPELGATIVDQQVAVAAAADRREKLWVGPDAVSDEPRAAGAGRSPVEVAKVGAWIVAILFLCLISLFVVRPRFRRRAAPAPAAAAVKRDPQAAARADALAADRANKAAEMFEQKVNAAEALAARQRFLAARVQYLALKSDLKDSEHREKIDAALALLEDRAKDAYKEVAKEADAAAARGDWLDARRRYRHVIRHFGAVALTREAARRTAQIYQMEAEHQSAIKTAAETIMPEQEQKRIQVLLGRIGDALTRARPTDVSLRLADGSAVEGTITRADARGVTLRVPNGTRRKKWDGLDPREVVRLARTHLKPLSAEDHLSLAILCLRSSLREEARTLFLKARELDPELSALVDAYLRKMRRPAARPLAAQGGRA